MRILVILSILFASQAVADAKTSEERAFEVTDDHGQPLEGATVFPSSWAELDAEGELTRSVGRPVYRTDEAGEVSLPSSRAYPEQRLLVLAPGKEPALLPFEATEARLSPAIPSRIPLSGVPAGAECTAFVRSDNAFEMKDESYSLSTQQVRIAQDALELPWVPGGRPLLVIECRLPGGILLRAGDRSLSPLPDEVALRTGPHDISIEVGFPYVEHTPSLIGLQCGDEQFIVQNPEQEVRIGHLPRGRCTIFGHWHSENESARATGAEVRLPRDGEVKLEWETEHTDRPHSQPD